MAHPFRRDGAVFEAIAVYYEKDFPECERHAFFGGVDCINDARYWEKNLNDGVPEHSLSWGQSARVGAFVIKRRIPAEWGEVAP
jgi:hypothetical protein